MQELDDMALLREYAEHGSEDAFAALVARHVNKVYSVALRHTGNPHRAEEISQAVFVILARKAGSLGKRVILEGWLYQTARLTAQASVRSDIRRARREQEAFVQSSLNENEVPPEMLPMLDTAIASLSKTDRHAIVLRFVYGKNMKEVGAALGVSEGATRLRLHRAMEKLRLFFGRRGVVSTAELIAGAISTVQMAPSGLARSATALAVAKAPAASSSTLTLIKGTLKFMAWTQAKTAITAGIIVLLVAGAAPVVVKQIQRRAGARFLPRPRTTVITGEIKGQFFGPGQLMDAGNTTPESAWESRYWARAQGDYDAVIAGTEPQARATAMQWMGARTAFHNQSRNEFASFLGFQILARKDVAADRVELKYQFAFQSGQNSTQTKIVVMKKVNGVWRCGETHSYDTNWDADSRPEPES